MVLEEAAAVVVVEEEVMQVPQGLQVAAVTMQTPVRQNLGEWLLCCGGRAGTQCAQLQAQDAGAPAAS
jgi:hypothetical protein